MTEVQKSNFEKLIEKYGFGEMNLGIREARYIAMVLGVAYDLPMEKICMYMDVKGDDFTAIDLKRICVMLDIELEKEDAEKIATLGQIKDYVHGVMGESQQPKSSSQEKSKSESQKNTEQKPETENAEDKELLHRYEQVFKKHHMSLEDAESGDILIKNMISDAKPYSRLYNYILNSGELSPGQLSQVMKAAKLKIPEEYIMRFAMPDIGVVQMEKAIELYQMQHPIKEEKKHGLFRK